jgi:hypothetical protein
MGRGYFAPRIALAELAHASGRVMAGSGSRLIGCVTGILSSFAEAQMEKVTQRVTAQSPRQRLAGIRGDRSGKDGEQALP